MKRFPCLNILLSSLLFQAFQFACVPDRQVLPKDFTTLKRLKYEEKYDSAIALAVRIYQATSNITIQTLALNEIEEIHELAAKALFDKAMQHFIHNRNKAAIELLDWVIEIYPETKVRSDAEGLLEKISSHHL